MVLADVAAFTVGLVQKGGKFWPLRVEIRCFIELSSCDCYPLCIQRRACGAVTEEDIVLSIIAEAATAADERSGLMGAAATEATSEAQLAAILTSLSDDKAEDVVEIDLRGKTAFGDYMVVASGRSSRQVAAISEKLVERLKAQFGRTARVEGKDTGDWVLIDTGDVVVHVFRPEVREFYQLEKMWLPAGQAAKTTN